MRRWLLGITSHVCSCLGTVLVVLIEVNPGFEDALLPKLIDSALFGTAVLFLHAAFRESARMGTPDPAPWSN